MILRFPRPTTRLISLNSRIHRMKVAEFSQTWRHATAMHARSQGLKPQSPSLVQVSLPVEPRHAHVRRDPSNFTISTKPVIDGLVDAGLWPDDTPQWVIELPIQFHTTNNDVLVAIEPRAAEQMYDLFNHTY